MARRVKNLGVKKLVYQGSIVGYRFKLDFTDDSKEFYDVSVKPLGADFASYLFANVKQTDVLVPMGDKLVTQEELNASYAVSEISGKPSKIESLRKLVMKAQSGQQSPATPTKSELSIYCPSGLFLIVVGVEFEQTIDISDSRNIKVKFILPKVQLYYVADKQTKVWDFNRYLGMSLLDKGYTEVTNAFGKTHLVSSQAHSVYFDELEKVLKKGIAQAGVVSKGFKATAKITTEFSPPDEDENFGNTVRTTLFTADGGIDKITLKGKPVHSYGFYHEGDSLIEAFPKNLPADPRVLERNLLDEASDVCKKLDSLMRADKLKSYKDLFTEENKPNPSINLL